MDPPVIATELIGLDRSKAMEIICQNHYTRSVPSGKSHYIQFEDAIVVWSIPANKNIAKFILGWPGNVWELSRLWAPDGHAPNLLTRAISAAVKVVVRLEKPDALVSYADPNAGHQGGYTGRRHGSTWDRVKSRERIKARGFISRKSLCLNPHRQR